MLIKEFGERIGFHKRYHVNESTIVYNTSGGGDFIEAAINALGIEPETLLRNTAKRHIMFHDQFPFQWPPHKHDMDKVVRPPELLMKFVKWLSKPEKNRDANDDLFDPSIIMLADLIWSGISGKRTCMKTLLGITVNGSTRSKELVMLLKELCLSISYNDVQDSYAAWTLYETIRNPSTERHDEVLEVQSIALLKNLHIERGRLNSITVIVSHCDTIQG